MGRTPKFSQCVDHLLFVRAGRCYENAGGGKRGPRPFIKDELNSCESLVGRVPVVLYHSLYRAVKLTYPRDIGVSLMTEPSAMRSPQVP